MQPGNDRNSNQGKPNRGQSFLPALTAEELQMLKEKRYICKHDVMRFLQISESTYHRYVAQGRLVPSTQFTKKLYDLDEIYRNLDAGKGAVTGFGLTPLKHCTATAGLAAACYRYSSLFAVDACCP